MQRWHLKFDSVALLCIVNNDAPRHVSRTKAGSPFLFEHKEQGTSPLLAPAEEAPMLSKLVLFGNISPGIPLHLWNAHADSACNAWTSRASNPWAAKRQLNAGLLEGTAIIGKGVVRRSDSSLSIGGVDGMDACTAEPRACGRAWVHCRCYVHSLALLPWCPGHASAELWG